MTCRVSMSEILAGLYPSIRIRSVRMHEVFQDAFKTVFKELWPRYCTGYPLATGRLASLSILEDTEGHGFVVEATHRPGRSRIRPGGAAFEPFLPHQYWN